jgi:hypothetical protein
MLLLPTRITPRARQGVRGVGAPAGQTSPCTICPFAWCRPSDRLSGLEPNDAPRQDTRTRRERPFDSARAGVTFITGQDKPKSIIRAHRNLHARDRFPHTDLKTVLSEVLSALSRSEQQASGDGASFEKVQTLKR